MCLQQQLSPLRGFTQFAGLEIYKIFRHCTKAGKLSKSLHGRSNTLAEACSTERAVGLNAGPTVQLSTSADCKLPVIAQGNSCQRDRAAMICKAQRAWKTCAVIKKQGALPPMPAS